MNLLEAIQGAGENWFRPVTWNGKAKALSVHKYGGCFIIHVPSDREASWYHPLDKAEEVTGEWEIVTPEQVLSERKL